jgi:hypothetical protein
LSPFCLAWTTPGPTRFDFRDKDIVTVYYGSVGTVAQWRVAPMNKDERVWPSGWWKQRPGLTQRKRDTGSTICAA